MRPCAGQPTFSPDAIALFVNCVYVLAYGASIDAKGIYVTGGRCLKPAIDTESMGVMTVTTCVRVGLQRRGWPS